MGAPLGRSPRAQLKTEGDINVKRVLKNGLNSLENVHMCFKGIIQHLHTAIAAQHAL